MKVWLFKSSDFLFIPHPSSLVLEVNMPASFVENYKEKHRHPLNRLTHSIGIPMIVISLPLFFFYWRWALGLFIIGWALQFLGQ